MTLQVQFLTLGLMAACGAMLGACFDTIGVVSREFRFHRVIQSLIDVLYWAAATVFVFRVLMAANYGEVRIFIFLGMAIGAILYSLILGKPLRKLVEMLIRLIQSIVKFVFRTVNMILIRPLLWLYRLLLKIVIAVGGFIATIAVFLGRIVIQWSKLVWSKGMARWFVRPKKQAHGSEQDETRSLQRIIQTIRNKRKSRNRMNRKSVKKKR